MVYKRLNICLILTMLLCSLFISLVECASVIRFFTYLGLCFLIVLPFGLIKTKYMPSSKQLFVYYVFIFLSDYLGCVCHFYNLISWYDIFIHFLAGMFLFLVALKFLESLKLDGNQKFNFFFAVLFVLGMSGLWEIFEFSCDVLFQLDMQKALVFGVRDTMEDMISALIGAIVLLEYKIFRL